MAAEPRELGILIQRARHRKRMTQRQVAMALGVDTVTVRNWERGKHFPQRNAGALEELLDIVIPAPPPLRERATA